jgi:nitric oxide reductase NorD protein
MEEQVGAFWHHLITRAAASEYPQAAARLEDISAMAAVVFRALGGDGGLRLEAASAVANPARRGWLQRIAGSHRRIELAWRDAETLRLPRRIALFPQPELNRDVYLWLAALAAHADAASDAPQAADAAGWFRYNQRLSAALLADFPGWRQRYARLVAALLPLRPDCAKLPPAEAAQELALQQALQTPGSIEKWPPAARHPPQFVPLWLYPAPPQATAKRRKTDSDAESAAAPSDPKSQKNQRRRAEQADNPDGKSGLLLFRLESLFTRAEYIKIDRCTDDEDDVGKAKDALDDLDQVSVAQDSQTSAVRLRFDLDLPPAENDDTPLGGGILLPEWDYRKRLLRADYCRLQPMAATTAPPAELPRHLRRAAQRLRRQFEAIAPVRQWHRGEMEGSEVDLDAWLLHAVDRQRGAADSGRGLYRDFRGGQRDLACLLLADLSLSTDAWVANHGRVIEVIRDSLFLFAESLSAVGDRFALHGFSSRSRNHVRFHHLKEFSQPYNAQARGRIAAIKPGYYTRMGAAVRHATSILQKQPASQRLLLLLTDGKPNDLDLYEGRYGVEDTRHAIHQARQQGLQVFCVTIDDQAGDYLPHLFGSNGYVLLHRATELPRRLPQLYLRLTAG